MGRHTDGARSIFDEPCMSYMRNRQRWHGKYSFKQHSIENAIKVKSAFDFPCLINSVCGSIYSY